MFGAVGALGVGWGLGWAKLLVLSSRGSGGIRSSRSQRWET